MSEGRNQGGEGAERDPGLDRLYRAGASEEPPARLDAAILAAARREVGARPRALTARLHAWRVPVSIAALVVLSVSLVTLVQEEGGEQLGQPSQQELFVLRDKAVSANQAARPEAPAEPESRKAPTREVAKAPEATSRADSALRSTAPAAADDHARPGPAEALTPPPAAAKPAPQPFPATPSPERAAPPAAADPGLSADRAAGSFGSRAAVSEELAGAAKSAPEPTAKAPAQMRDTAPAGEAAGVTAPRSQVAPKPVERPRARAEARLQKKEGPAPDAAYLAGLMKELDPQPPEKWLERIEALRRDGRTGEADELLAEFKRRFPTYPLPAGLR